MTHLDRKLTKLCTHHSCPREHADGHNLCDHHRELAKRRNRKWWQQSHGVQFEQDTFRTA